MIPRAHKDVDVIRSYGGIATLAQLRCHLTRREIDDAVAAGRLERLGRGTYALQGRQMARHAAARLNGTVSHLSAAMLHGWEVAREPSRPWVTVPKHREVATDESARVVYGRVDGDVTDPLRTVLECARRLPFGEALAVADSALRHRDITPDELRTTAAGLRGPGAAMCRRVADHASALAANPFESVLRSLAIEVGLEVRPQVAISLPGREVHPDLVDVGRRLIVEADSHLHHGRDSLGFENDLWRYTSLTVAGWVVLRFGYHHVMLEAEWVKECLRAFLTHGRQAEGVR